MDDTPRRETGFFDRNYTKGLDWYRRRLAGRAIAGAPVGRELFVETGHYARHLGRFFDHFDRAQILVALFDDLSRDPREVFTRAAGFVGADPETVPDVVGSKINVHAMFRSRRARRWAERLPPGLRDVGLRVLATVNTREAARPPMSPEAERRLRDHYAEHDGDLVGLLGHDVPWHAARP